MQAIDGIKPTVPSDFQGTLVPMPAQKRQVLAHDTAVEVTPAFERYFETLRKIEATKQENIAITAELDELTQNVETLTERVRIRQNEIKELESHIEEHSSHIQERESHINELNEQNLLLLRQRDEQELLKAALVQRRATLASQLEEANQLIAEGQAQIELGLSQQAMSEELTVKIAQSRAKIEALNASIDQHKENERRLQASAAAREERAAKLRESAAQHRESAAQLRESAAQRRESAAQCRESVTERRQVAAQCRASTADKFKPLLCKFFNQAFYGKDATIAGAPADALYSEYLSHREITVGKDSAGKACVQVNDTAPFIRFSQDHSDITSCNLSAFTFIETHTQPLIDHLSSKDCPLTTVTFSNRLSQTLQQLFTQASLDNGSLTINFVGSSSSTKASSSS